MLSEKELKTRIDFLSASKCNHTFHKYIDITGDLIEGTLLSRILYWFAPTKDKKSKLRIFKDDHYWIAKQRRDWWEEIRITERQYDKAIKELVKKDFVITAKYKFNSMPTIHIRPNYEAIDKAVTLWEENLKEEIMAEEEMSELHNMQDGNYTKCNSLGNDIKCKTGMTESVNLLTGITNTDYNSRDYNTGTTIENKTLPIGRDDKNFSLSDEREKPKPKTAKERYLDKKANELKMQGRILTIAHDKFDKEIADEVFNGLCYYLAKYTEKTNLIHPILTDNTLTEIITKLGTFQTDYGDKIVDCPNLIQDMIDEFFNTDFGSRTGQKTNWNLPHFMSDTILNMLSERLK